MSFNPDITKEAQEIVFSRKKNDTSYLSLCFNNAQIQRQSAQKHLGLILDEKLSFFKHIDVKIKKATVVVNLICKLNFVLPHSFLLSIVSVLLDLIWTTEM